MGKIRSLNGSIGKKDSALCGEIAVIGNERISGTVPGDLELTAPHPSYAYKGPYDVVPDLKVQTLKTSGKTMEQDVTVEEIPIYAVSNNSGGTTVIIGG